jgi:cytochrome oxidase Cu insertion factor (SCO1/SenC/PrrC family)
MKQKLKYLENYLSILALICVVCIAVCYVFFTIPHKKRIHKKTADLAYGKNLDYVYNFSLTDHLNKNLNAATLKDKPTLLYFGFTFCPDICPTALGKIANIVDVLKKYGIELNTVFITIDPERDTTKVLANYVKFFDENMIGLTGTPEQIKEVASIFKVYYAKDEASNSKDYMINHSSFIYVVDKNGHLVKFFSFQEDPKIIIEFIRINLRK